MMVGAGPEGAEELLSPGCRFHSLVLDGACGDEEDEMARAANRLSSECSVLA